MITSRASRAPLARAGDEIRSAWAVPYVRLGLLGTLLVTVGSLTPAFLPQASPVWPTLRALGLDGTAGRVTGTVLTVSGLFLLAHAWLRLRARRFAHLAPLAIVFLWSLPCLISPPLLSHDVYSYGAQGWMIHNGQNPYDGGPSLVPGAFADYAPWAWRYTAAPYGPLALQVAHLVVEMSNGMPWVAAYLMRIPAGLAVATIVLVVPRIARQVGARVHQAVWLACLNPLLVLDYVGGAHNDAWMMGLVVLAIWLALRPGWWLASAALIGVAASIKQPAIMAAIFLPLLTVSFPSWRPSKPVVVALARCLVSLIIAVGVFVGISFACGLGFGWITALGVPGAGGSIAPAYLIGSGLQWLINPDGTWWMTLVSRIFLVVGAVGVVWVTIRRGPQRPLQALSWSWLITAAALSALHSWYLLWGGLLLPLSRPGRKLTGLAVWVVLIMLGVASIDVGQRNGVACLVVSIVAVVAWGVYLILCLRLWRVFTHQSWHDPVVERQRVEARAKEEQCKRS
ncbi:MAG: polyprenol phosphomannose-dependent alpha 1,6 mannosyltransferase MptB [Propionibacteriaceae bacterium]|jgi:hypothetical protein|nr:polyprenol phosphomannose-dependent alpha 1,6 mannosyltransferase MptB [Propionibacteriaceae bacterium]